MYERSALDYLICNAPMEYVELILSGEIYEDLPKYTDYPRLDGTLSKRPAITRSQAFC